MALFAYLLSDVDLRATFNQRIPSETMAGEPVKVLLVGLFSDEQDASSGRAFAEDGLRGSPVEVAALAARRRSAQGGKRSPLRKEIRRGLLGSRSLRP